jgi:hypothetical protein
MFVKNGDGKILNIVEAESVNVDNKKLRKAIDKQKKIAKNSAKAVNGNK